jgi:hypothetical protein
VTKQEQIDTLKRIAQVLPNLSFPSGNKLGEMVTFLDALRQTAVACDTIAKALEAEMKPNECGESGTGAAINGARPDDGRSE